MKIPNDGPFTTADFIAYNDLPKELAYDGRFTKPLHAKLKSMGYRKAQRKIPTGDGQYIIKLAWVRDPNYNVDELIAKLGYMK